MLRTFDRTYFYHQKNQSNEHQAHCTSLFIVKSVY